MPYYAVILFRKEDRIMKQKLKILCLPLALVLLLTCLLFAVALTAGAASTVDYITDFTAKPNKQGTRTELSDGGWCFEKPAGEDSHPSTSFKTTGGATVTVELSLRAEEGKAILPLNFRLRNSSSQSYSFLSLSESGALSLLTGEVDAKGNAITYPIGTITSESYLDLAFSVTFDSGDDSAYTINVYLGGKLLYENMSFSTANAVVTANSASMSLYIYAGRTASGATCLRGIRASSAASPATDGAYAHLFLDTDAASPADFCAYPYGTATALPTPTREGYDFAGWYTSPELSGSPVYSIPASASGILSYYAKFVPHKHTVKWVVGDTVTSEIYDYGTIPVAPSTDRPATSDEAYTFTGWYDGQIRMHTFPPVSGDITYTAQYAIDKGYDLIYYRTYEGINPYDNISFSMKTRGERILTTDGENSFLRIRLKDKAAADTDFHFDRSMNVTASYMVISFSLSGESSTFLPFSLNFRQTVIETGAINSPGNYLLSMDKTGAIKVNGAIVGQVTPGEWTDVLLYLELDTNYMTTYIDGVQKSRYQYTTAAVSGARNLRFYMTGTTTGTSYDLDNLAIYTLLAPNSSIDKLPVLPDPERYEGTVESDKHVAAIFNGSLALKTGSDAMLSGGMPANGGQVIRGIAPPEFYRGAIYLPVGAVAEALGYTVTGSGSSLTLTGGRTIAIAQGSTASVGGQSVTLSEPAVLLNGELFASANDLASLFEKQLYTHAMGLAIFSDDPEITRLDMKNDRAIITALTEEFVFEKPTGETVLADAEAKLGDLDSPDSHPRLIAGKDAFARARAAYTASESTEMKSWITSQIAAADAYLTRANDVYGYDVGNRMGTKSQTFLFPWSFAWQMTYDYKYASRALGYIYALALFDDWNPGHALNCADTAQGVAVAYDWMFDAWCNTAYWTEEAVRGALGATADLSTLPKNADGTYNVKKLIEDTLYYYAVAAAVGSYNGTTDQSHTHGTGGRSGWRNGTNNWNCVCNNGYLMSAIALAGLDTPIGENCIPTSVSTNFMLDPGHKSNLVLNPAGGAKPLIESSNAYSTVGATAATTYREEIAWLLTGIMESLEIGVRCYMPDGSYGESAGYWAYGTNNLFLLCETLYAATGTTYGFMETPGIDKTLYFAMHIESADNKSWAYHDGSSGSMQTQHASFVGPYFGDAALATLRYESIISGRKSASMYDILFYDASFYGAEVELPLSYYMEGIDTVTMRTGWEAGDIFTGLHGGYNSVNHGDMDAGAFTYQSSGIDWFPELGSDDYNLPGYFGGGVNGSKWKYYRKSAEGQNTMIVVSDPELPYGQNPTADITVTGTYDLGSYAYSVLDMAPTYGAHAIIAERGILLDRESGATILQDELHFDTETSLYWLSHVSTGSITLDEGGRVAYLTAKKNGVTHTLRLSIVSENADFKWSLIDCEDTLLLPTTALNVEGEHGRSQFTRLAIYLHDIKDAILSVVIEEVASVNAAPTAYETMPIAEWGSYNEGKLILIDGESTRVIEGESATIPSPGVLWYGSDGNIYAGGETIAVTERLTLTALRAELLSGGSIRTTAQNSGLSFETVLPENVYALLEELGVTWRMGTLILPTDRLGAAEYTARGLAEAGISYLDLYSAAPELRDGVPYIRTAVTDLFPQNYTRAFSARSYIAFTYGGTEYISYSSYNAQDNSRSVYQVASLLYATDRDSYSSERIAIIKSYIDGVCDLSSEGGVLTVRNAFIEALDPSQVRFEYVSPYSASYDTETMTLTVTGSVPKTVFLDCRAYTGGWTVREGGITANVYVRDLFPPYPEAILPDRFNDPYGESFGN